ncbi:sulfate reduction electron transfer complex DsrMKJOP subunit DsrP [Deferrisoma camini]|uniref:sulfate reduction electron transfer complex DsrMKJOP subunit DsrP n=1 Tax=Deferrisoma camini TaxID=1035120 RepID=UPI00046CC992|nr:NrfD/PsrC family molybdoenzyme membrane anchor subunit [Deferrisoma camini]
MNTLMEFLVGTFILAFRGGKKYYLWMGSLILIALVGLGAWVYQLKTGLGVTGMRDPVSWGLYIANFTFLVGVAAAAVLLVIPAYIYKWGPIKEIVLLGELLAVAAISMCLMFVTFDLGHPERFWHLIPGLGILNFPISMLSWDVVVLNVYLAVNLIVPIYILYNAYLGREPNYKVLWPLIIFSIPAAVSIHTVTAFLYNGFPSRPFWNASILAPRFIASAFCSGPSFIILAFQLIRKHTQIKIQDRAIFKLAEIIAYAMGINLFLLIAEVFKEYYSATVHLAPMKYLFQGLEGHNELVPFIWTAIAFNTIAFFLFLTPKTRENFFTLNLGCVLMFIGVWIEKGPGLILPGFVPTPLGEMWSYAPTLPEVLITLGIWAIGLIIYTLLLKVAIPIEVGEFRQIKERLHGIVGQSR